MLKTILFILLSVLPLQVFGAVWATNKDHSEIMFQVPYMGVSDLTGRFNEFNAFLDDGELRVTIQAASIDTGNKMRDGHLKSADFFQTTQYPDITFVSKIITPIKANEYKANGVLTIKNISRPAIINFSITEPVKDTWGYANRFVKFKSSLNRKDFKITWNKTLSGEQLLVGETVSFWGTFQLQPSKGKTPNSKHMIPDTNYLRERESELRKKAESNSDNESSFSKKIRNLINGKGLDE